VKKLLKYFITVILFFLFFAAITYTRGYAVNTEALNYFSLGFYFYYEGNLRKAKTYFEQAARLESEPNYVLYSILAEVSSMLGEREEAKKYAKRSLELKPDNPESLRIISSILVSEQNYEEAKRYLEELLRIRPDDYQTLYYLAEVYDALNDDNSLIDIYNKILQINPHLVEVRLNLAQLYLKKGAIGLAKNEYLSILKDDPENERAMFYLAYIYLSEANTEKAIEVFRKLYDKKLLESKMIEDYIASLFVEGYDPTPLISKIEKEEELNSVTRGIMAFYSGDYTMAKKLFKKAIDENKDSITPYYGLVRIAEAKRDMEMEKRWRFVLAGIYYQYNAYRRALGEAIRVKQIDEAYIENRYLLGDIYRAMGKYKLALEEYNYFLKNSREIGDVYVKIGFTYDSMGENEKAREAFEKAIEISPDNDRLYYYLGIECRILKDYEGAIEAFKRAVEIDADNADYLFNLGVSYERSGKIDKAIEYLEKSIKLNDKDPIALNYLGYLLADKGIRLKEAKEYIARALEYDPNNGAYLDSMGWVYYRLGDYEKAREYLEMAIQYIDESDEENYLIYEHLGDVYYKIQMYEDAIRAWQKALEIKYVRGIYLKIKRAEVKLRNM